MRTTFVSIILLIGLVIPLDAFVTPNHKITTTTTTGVGHCRPVAMSQTPVETYDDGVVEDFLQKQFPEFFQLLSKNEEVWKELKTAEAGYTLFAPNSKAFSDLDKKKQDQLSDPRNDELVMKIGSYHAIAEPVTAKQIFESGGLITLGGEVPTFLLKGGFFGFGGGGEETVTINSAKLLYTYEIGPILVHEVDSFVSPKILWRYADQLRIPGSK